METEIDLKICVFQKPDLTYYFTIDLAIAEEFFSIQSMTHYKKINEAQLHSRELLSDLTVDLKTLGKIDFCYH